MLLNIILKHCWCSCSLFRVLLIVKFMFFFNFSNYCFLHFFLGGHLQGFRHFMSLFTFWIFEKSLKNLNRKIKLKLSVYVAQNDGNHEDGLLEKSVENKSCLKFNFKQLLFSTLFSSRSSSWFPSFRATYTANSECDFVSDLVWYWHFVKNPLVWVLTLKIKCPLPNPVRQDRATDNLLHKLSMTLSCRTGLGRGQISLMTFF